jgi:hypothetical protein
MLIRLELKIKHPQAKKDRIKLRKRRGEKKMMKLNLE